MVSEGNIAGASRLATTPGVLKPSAAGSQIKQIGRGSEGIASLVAHPEHGVAVRKLYDPRGISTPTMIQQKEEAGRALGNNPNVAKFLGSAQTPHGGGTMHFNEYVPSAAGPKPGSIHIPTTKEREATRLNNQRSDHTAFSARKALQGVGFEGHDIRRGNMVQDVRTGQHKVVDYMPARPGEVESDGRRLFPTPSGMHLFNIGQNAPTTTKGMLGGMLGGNQPMGVRKHVGVQRHPMRPLDPPGSSVSQPSTPSAPSLPSAATSVLAAPKPSLPSAGDATQVLKTPKPVKAIAPIQP